MTKKLSPPRRTPARDEWDKQRQQHWSKVGLPGYELPVGPAVSVFGFARFKEDHRYYHLAHAAGAALARAGFATLTGGGPGVMEAANRGAHEADGASYGLNIILPHEQSANPYVDRSMN